MDRINQVLDTPVTVADNPNGKEINDFHESIEFRKVSFSYGDLPVIQSLDLTIRKGETVALVGPSGSGKSTLADLLTRFYEPDQGSILVDGHDIRNIRVQSLRKLFGIVPQEPLLFNGTLAANIAFGDDTPNTAAVLEAAEISYSNEFISQMPGGLEAKVGDRGATLSGGQRQRICLARAVYRNPPILILDEATSSLDSESEKMVQVSLQNLMVNRTTLVIAHRLSTVQNADRIYVIREGRVAEQGTHAALMDQKGEYYRLYNMQNPETPNRPAE